MCARAADTTSVTLRKARVLRRNTLVRIGALSSAAALVALLGPSLPAAAQAGQPGTRVVVRLVSDANPTVKAQDSQQSGSQVTQVYDGAITGYAATVPAAELGRLARDPAVLSIEPDTTLRTSDTQNSAPWPLDRIDQAALPLDSSYTYPIAGQGVSAYVIDTGLNATHTEFTGRVRPGFGSVSTFDANGAVTGTDTSTGDCDGHGTHVAGELGGRTYGVAKAVTLVPVRVLDCAGGGALSDVLAGIDWIIADHQAGQPAVANLSLGGPPSPALDAAVQAMVNDGISVAVAAGNSAVDACSQSPSRAPAALTVAAADITDTKASFSNDGTCVDLFAPGVNAVSAWIGSNTATRALSGTSMAAPLVAGTAAVVLAQDFTLTPDQVAARIVAAATPNGILGLLRAGTPNRELRMVALPRAPAPAGVDVFYALVLRR
jgi:subtilisin family serine protease